MGTGGAAGSGGATADGSASNGCRSGAASTPATPAAAKPSPWSPARSDAHLGIRSRVATQRDSNLSGALRSPRNRLPFTGGGAGAGANGDASTYPSNGFG